MHVITWHENITPHKSTQDITITPLQVLLSKFILQFISVIRFANAAEESNSINMYYE